MDRWSLHTLLAPFGLTKPSGCIIYNSAFLNGFLEEELYMMQPEGFVDPKGANKVCKLQRSIYGLVQASRSWNKRFDSVIKAYGFIQTFGEACIYKKVSGSSVAFLKLYVDDILLLEMIYKFWIA